MKLQRTTLTLLISAIALSGIVYLVNGIGQSRRTRQAQQQKQILPLVEEEIVGLEIATLEDDDEEAIILKRDRSQPETQQWAMTEPKKGQANAATVEFLMNLLVEGERQQTFLINASDRATYGLEEPFATIEITVEGEAQPQMIQLGGPNFDQKFIYAQINPDEQPEQDQDVLLVPVELQYAVERTPQEWLALESEDEEIDIEESDTDQLD